MGNHPITLYKTKQTFGSDPSSIDTSVKNIGQAAEQAARREAEKWQGEYTRYKEEFEQEKCSLQNQIAKLTNEKKELSKQIQEHVLLKEEVQAKETELQRMQVDLRKEKEKLSSEQRQFTKEKDDFRSLITASREARKMYGDVTPYDVTHDDVKSEFIQFFKTFNHVLVNFDKVTDKNRLAVSIFQDAFHKSQEKVIEILAQQLKDLLEDPTYEVHSNMDLCTQEKRNDVSRAFSLLLYHAKLHQEEIITSTIDTIQQNVKKKYESEHSHTDISLKNDIFQRAAQIAFSMVTRVPPMICSVKPNEFDDDIHEIKHTSWKVESPPYELTYIRPILFYGQHGAVAVKGQVGNNPIEKEDKPFHQIIDNKSVKTEATGSDEVTPTI